MTAFDNEKAFTRWLLAEARKRGWKAAHLETYQVVRSRLGPIAVPSREAAGFPDCVLAHPVHGFRTAELKMPHAGRRKPRQLSEEQVAWIVALRAAGVPVDVWYPHDEVEIVDVLEGREITTRLDLDGATA